MTGLEAQDSPPTSPMPAVIILALGGTIAMTPAGSGGVVPNLTADMLVAAVPLLPTLACVEARAFRQLPGAHLGFADIEALAREIVQAIESGAAGVVITQGTDTIEETAFALDRLLDVEAPVVVTGAMRNPTLPGADGPANLFAAVAVAASPHARGLGVLVVMNDEIHAARFVRKTHTSSPAAFTSSTSGPIGIVAEGAVRVLARVAPIATVPSGGGLRDAPVPLITLGLGDDGRMIEAAALSGVAGMVIGALGGGHASPAAADAIERAALKMPVVLASRTGAGEVLRGTYGFLGSEIDLVRRGAIRAGSLDGLKSRILLSLALRCGGNAATVRQLFAAWDGG